MKSEFDSRGGARLAAVVAVIVVAVGAAAGGYWIGTRNAAPERGVQGTVTGAAATTAAPSAATDTAGRKVLYWHDPMVPGQKFDKPGKSPFMDMQLVPVYADGSSDEGGVSISSRVQQNLGVRTAEVTRGVFTSTVEAVGSVAYNERDVAVVQARSNGFLERLYVRAPLDPVRKGQPLAELFVPDWVAAQEEYLSVRRLGAQPGRKTLDGLTDAAAQRMRLAGMSDEQIRAVETSGKVQPRLTITASIGGVVGELTAREGMTVMTGAPLFRINGLSTVWVNAEVPESLAAQVRPGNPVEARTPAVSGAVFKGKVSAILPEVNPTTRTIKVRIELANPTVQLVPGMYATVNFAPAGRKEVLLVPSEAVIQTGKRSVVVVAQGDGKFAPVDVEVGLDNNGQTEIRKGLQAGQKVVVSGQFLVDSEANLKGALARLAGAAAAGAAPAAQIHKAEGVVRAVGDEVLIKHSAIPSAGMGAMTMAFKAPKGGVPKDVTPGASVSFEFVLTPQGDMQLMSIVQIPEKK
jgi:membrane fusion protein, copper/silver efflux system